MALTMKEIVALAYEGVTARKEKNNQIEQELITIFNKLEQQEIEQAQKQESEKSQQSEDNKAVQEGAAQSNQENVEDNATEDPHTAETDLIK